MTVEGHGTVGIAVALREGVRKANQSKEDRAMKTKTKIKAGIAVWGT
jgi:hypothetical protein